MPKVRQKHTSATRSAPADALPGDALRLMLDTLTLGVLLEDPSETIVYANQPLADYFGLASPQLLVGLRLSDGLRRLLSVVVQPDPERMTAIGDDHVLGALSGQVWQLQNGRRLQLLIRPLNDAGTLWQFSPVSTTASLEYAAHTASMHRTATLLFALDGNGTLLSVEGSLSGLRNDAPREYIGMNAMAMLAEFGLHSLIPPFRRALAGEDVMTTFETRHGALDLNLSAVTDASGAVERVLGVLNDSTSRRQTELLLRHHSAALEYLHQVSLELVNRHDLADLLQGIVERAAVLLGSGHGYIYLVESDDSRMVVRYGCGIFEQFLGFRMERGEGIAGKVWANGAPLVVDDYDVWSGRSNSFDRQLIRAVACVPLRAHGQIIGVIGVSTVDGTKTFSADDVRLLSQFGELASVALDNARLYQSTLDEIEERRRTEAALRQSEARYRSVVTAMGEGIIVLDADGIMTEVNTMATRIMGLSAESILAHHIMVFEPVLVCADGAPFPASDYPALKTLKTGEPYTGVIVGVRPPNLPITWLSVNSQPIMGEDGRPSAVVVSFSDITEHKRIQAELQQHIDQVTRLEQLKTQMIRVAAHDIRSPLGVVGGYVTLLRDDLGPAGAPYESFFEGIFRALERMDHMTGDILSLERIHATHNRNFEVILINELVKRAYADHRDQMQTKRMTCALQGADSPLSVYGDPVQVYEAIVNLISNAIKYTPDGGHIEVSLHNTQERAIFEVRDSGYGISTEAQTMLFEPFYRVKTEETRQIDGTGLGLFLVKEIIERHNGEMHFESALGQGSLFGFELPLHS
jgi:signal transduction histidine kinase/uncharacterized protein YigA (DUF484 family)